MVDEQQAVPVAQEDREAAANVVASYRDQKNGNWQQRIRDGLCDDGEMVQAFARHRLASLPCKSGEGVDLAVWCAREAEARRAEGNSSPHTAKLTREGRYDDQGVMPVAIEAARIALGLSTPDATQTREAELIRAVKDDLRGPDGEEYTDSGMEDAFFRWPVVERALRAALNARGGA